MKKRITVKKTAKSKASKSKKVVKAKLAGKSKAKSNSSLIRTNINMEKALHGQIKSRATKENTSINKLINTAINAYLNK